VDVGVWPPSVRIVSPRDGAVVGQQLKVRVEALDNEPVRQLQLLGQGVPGWPDPGPTAAGDGLFEFTWSPYPGLPSAELFAVAWDPYRSVESDRIHVRVAFPWASPAPALGAPRCPVTADCRTGDLVHGRGPTESESPNTLGGSCPDGGGYQYPGDIALHELRIHTLDGLALAAGKAARVEASIEAAYPGARLEVFVAPDASAPSWTFAGSADQAGPGWGSLALDLTVPAGGAVAAVRGRLVPLDEAGEPVAVVTRARVRARHWRTFATASRAVSSELHRATGLLAVCGIGEAPIGRQATFSLWRTAADARTYATQNAQHRDVVRRTRSEGWYGEELFATFLPFAATGTWDGGDPLVQQS